MRLTVARKFTLAGTLLVALLVAVGFVARQGAQELEEVARALRATSQGSLGAGAVMAAGAMAQAARIRTLLELGAVALLLLLPWAAVTLFREVANRVAAQNALASSEARFRAAVEGSLDAYYVLRTLRDAAGGILDFEFVDLNREAERLLGRTRDQVIGQRLCELVPSNRSNGFMETYAEVMELGEAREGEYEVTDTSVRAAWIQYQVVPLGDGVAITSRDITERKQREDALHALSLMDELTGLYNRRGFFTLAQQQLKLARRGHRELVLLFVDMDDFKDINDQFGHKEGDVALQRTSAILRHTFRDSDIVARIGGDEFVVLATDIAHGTGPLIVDRLRAELRERNAREGYPYRLSFSVGIATFDPDHPPEIDELLATADAMLYEQKRQRQEPAGVA